jgi:hypothetical protein
MEDWNTYLKRNKLPLMIVVGCVIILNLFDNYYTAHNSINNDTDNII